MKNKLTTLLISLLCFVICFFTCALFYKKDNYKKTMTEIVTIEKTSEEQRLTSDVKESTNIDISNETIIHQNDTVIEPNDTTTEICNTNSSIEDAENTNPDDNTNQDIVLGEFVPDSLVWENGSLWQGNNDDSSEFIITTRIRTNQFTVKKGDTIILSDSAKGKLKYSVHLMNEIDGEIVFIKETGWLCTNLPYAFDGEYIARIVCAYIRDASIETTVGENNFSFNALGYWNAGDYLLQSLHDKISLPNMYIISHRGYTEQYKYPDNSMAAFTQAAKLGYRFIETDLHNTFDNHIVICHNPTIDSTTNGTGRIDSMTLEKLKEYTLANGETIPTLEEFLTLCKIYDISPVLELKGISYYDEIKVLIDTLEKFDIIERTFIIAFDRSCLYIANGINSNLNLVYLIEKGKDISDYVLKEASTLGKTRNNRFYIGYEEGVNINWDVYERIKSYGLDGIIVHVVNEESRANEVIPYVKGYITDSIIPHYTTP